MWLLVTLGPGRNPFAFQWSEQRRDRVPGNNPCPGWGTGWPEGLWWLQLWDGVNHPSLHKACSINYPSYGSLGDSWSFWAQHDTHSCRACGQVLWLSSSGGRVKKPGMLVPAEAPSAEWAQLSQALWNHGIKKMEKNTLDRPPWKKTLLYVF